MKEMVDAHGTNAIQAGTQEAERPCCLFHSALEALTVPVIVHDDKAVLYANPEALKYFGSALAEVRSRPIDSFLHPDSREPAADRRRIGLEAKAALHGVQIKANAANGRMMYAVVDGEPIRYGESKHAIVQLARYVDGDSFVTYLAPPARPQLDDEPDPPCLHCAAFDALPVPVVIQDRNRIVGGNLQSRLVLSGGERLEDTPLSAVLHSDFVDAGRERRDVVLDQGHTYRGLSAKLKTLDGDTVFIVVDGAPLDHEGERLAVLVARDVRVM